MSGRQLLEWLNSQDDKVLDLPVCTFESESGAFFEAHDFGIIETKDLEYVEVEMGVPPPKIIRVGP